MGELGNANGTAATADHLLINLNGGNVSLSTIAGCNIIEDKGSSYDPNTKTFTLTYIYTKGGASNYVNEVLILRQDVEKELRFGTW